MKKEDLSLTQIKIIAGTGIGLVVVGVITSAVLFGAGGGFQSTQKKDETPAQNVNADSSVIEQKEDVKLKTDEEISEIKSKLWALLENKETDEASKEMLKIYKTTQFTDENDLEQWHLDISAVATAAMLPYGDRLEVLRGLQVPRIQSAFSVYTTPLNTTELVIDEESLIPVDVDNFTLVEEIVISKDEFDSIKNASEVVENFKEQAKSFYIEHLNFDGENVYAIVAVLSNDETVLIGYYSDEETPYSTASFWNENRELFQDMPIMK